MNKRQCVLAVLVAGAIGATSVIADGQTNASPEKDDLFAGTEKFAQGASSVTQIDMDPDSLAKVDGKDGTKARKMLLSVVHTYEYDKPGMYRIEDVEAFRKKLETGDWHCSVHIREMKTGESTDVCNKRRKDELTEQAVITVEPKSLTFIHTIGRGDPRSDSPRMPLKMEMNLIDPEMQAELAITPARIQSEMAIIRPELDRALAELHGSKGPDPEAMKRMEQSLKSFHLEGRGNESK